MEVADTTRHLFFIVGAPEEGDTAMKRIKKIIQKVGAL
jgi:ribosomal protein S21